MKNEKNIINNLKQAYVYSNGEYSEYNFGKNKAVIVFSPKLIHHILSDNESFLRGITFLKMKTFFGNGLLVSEEPEHIKNKTVIQKSFHKNKIEKNMHDIFNVINKTFNEWDNQKEIPLATYTNKITLESVSKSFFNSNIFTDYVKNLHKVSELVAKSSGIKFSDDELSEFIVVQNIISNFVKNENHEGTLIQTMIDANMSHDQIVDEVFTILGAGWETTNSTILWSLCYLNENPKILEKLKNNIPEWVKENRPPSIKEIGSSDIINKIIKETLRIAPPGYFTNRIAIKNIKINEINIEKNSHIFISPYITHRIDKYYENPEIWNPERWTEDFEKNLPPGSYIPFGYGAKRCIGEQFAKIVISMFILMFVYNYDFKIKNGFPEPEYLISMIPKGLVDTEITRML